MNKRVLKLALLLLSSFFCHHSFAQIPKGFNYQAVIRDAGGEPMVNQNVTLRFSIWQQGWPDENIEYQETHTTTTNEFGMVNRVVGQGTPTEGSWNNIEWHQPYSQLAWLLRVEVNSGNGYVDLGSQQFSSVPYAELAKNNWSLHGNSGTDSDTQFIGTTDYEPIVFKVENAEKMNMNTWLTTSYNDIEIVGSQPGLALSDPNELNYGSLANNNGVTNLVNYGGVDLETYFGKIKFTEDGLLGVGDYFGSQVYDPQARLHVCDGTDAILATDASGYFIIGDVDGSNIVMDSNEIISRNNGLENELYLQAEGGGVVINSTTSTTHELYVNGTAAKPGGGSWTATSDARLKENVQPFTQGLDEVMEINPVTYHYIQQTGHDVSVEHVGVIAQDLQKISPNMVSESEMELVDGTKGDYLSVDPSAFTYMLINAVQELQKTNEAQQKRIEELSSRLEALERGR